MGHDVHFLERLDRVSLDHQTLALALYRDPVMTRRFVAALAERDGVPGERIAFALEDGGQGPHVIVTRAGRFVTCLGRGMVLSEEVPIISRAQLNANREWMQRMRQLEGDGAQELDRWMKGLTGEGCWPSRAQLEQLGLFCALYENKVLKEFMTNLELVEQGQEQLVNMGRRGRRLLHQRVGDQMTAVIHGMVIHRRYMAHMAVLYGLSLSEGEPMRIYSKERDKIPTLACELGELGTPMALLRAAWLLDRREQIKVDDVFNEMRELADAYICMPLIYSLMWLGEICSASMYGRYLLIGLLLTHMGELLEPDHPASEELSLFIKRTLWVASLRDLSLAERARQLRAHPDTEVPAWAERFYDPVALEQRPEAMVQELLAHDAAWIMTSGEAMVLWLYMPEIKRRGAALLYPREPEPPLTGRARAARDALYMRELVRVTHRTVEARVEPTRVQGRNEPCACGSGKKYKKCCGVEA